MYHLRRSVDGVFRQAKWLVGRSLAIASKLRADLRYVYSRLVLDRKLGEQSPEYEEYLNTQLRRTVAKLGNPVLPRVNVLVDLTARFVDLSKCSVLCIGCRDGVEIDSFLEKGAREVVGIDLQSRHNRVLIMDMHKMEFPAGNFDVVYCSHSLEHAFDIGQVVAEIGRVAKVGATVVVEVPVQFEPRGADLIDFGDIDGLHSVFGRQITQVLWAESLPAHSKANGSGTTVVRSVFRIKGDPSA